MVDVALRRQLTSLDFTTRGDGTLGPGWVDGHAWDPAIYEPLGVRDGAIACTDPMARDVTYDPDQVSLSNGGKFMGIGCAWRPTVFDAPTVTMMWSGYNTSAAWIEVAPLIHVVPGTVEHGLGVWCSQFGGSGFLLLGSITNPSENFGDNVLSVAGFAHTTGTPREIELRSDGEAVTVWLDGSQVSMPTGGYNLDPIPIPAALLGSTLHGFAVDAHLTTDPADVPLYPAATSWEIGAT